MKDRVKKSDWHTVDMPEPFEVAKIDRLVSKEDYEALVCGFNHVIRQIDGFFINRTIGFIFIAAGRGIVFLN